MEISAGEAARQFVTASAWDAARWIATAYQCHPESQAPPVMGLVFADWGAGVKLFRTWVDQFGNVDLCNDIRVTVVEGHVTGVAPDYSIRISAAQADWEQVHMNRSAVSHWQRMHPLPDNPDMLQDFKREYLKHGEFLLCPIVLHDNDELHFNIQAGIIKRECVFREASDIQSDESDAIVFQPPLSALFVVETPEES